jgi:hypothetical protein
MVSVITVGCPVQFDRIILDMNSSEAIAGILLFMVMESLIH